MLTDMLLLSSVIFGFIFLILLVIFLTRKDNHEERSLQQSDLKKIKDQINGNENINHL